MKMILTAGLLSAALLLAVISAVNAKTANGHEGEKVALIDMIGE